MKATWFGRYLLLDRVASGGMAEVWRAKITGESGFQRIIAVKKILPHVSEDPDFIAMFTDEANITVQLQHPNIGQVYEFSKLDDIYYIAMEYISGKDVKTVWSHMRQRKTVIPASLACYIVQKMAEGLAYAHNKRDNFGNPLGIVHRDVSPQNCLISWDGEVKVIDFGIAKAEDKQSRTRAGTLKGKFAYMSPEQIRGLRLDGRADTFALGVVLYELLTGERGFQAESEFSLLEKVRNVEIKPPTMVNREIPPDLERIVFKALAKDRDDRYADAGDLAEDLQRYLLSAGKPPRANDLGEFLRQNFTVDYDKERLRLESYKEIEVEPPPDPKKASAPTDTNLEAVNPAPEAFDPVKAAMAEMSQQATGTFMGPGDAFAGPSSPGATQGGTQSGYTNSGRTFPGATPTGESRPYVISRPGADPTGVTPVTGPGNRYIAPPMQRQPAQAQPEARSSAGLVLKIVLAVLLTLVVVGGGAFAALTLLGGKGTIVVTVPGAALGASVRLDGALIPEQANPSVTISGVKAGTHTIIVEKDGFRTYTGQVIVPEEGTAQLNAQLKRVGGRVRVLSEPSGAALLFDGTVTGDKTPATLEDVEGGITHRIELKLEGYKDGVENVQVKAGEEKVLTVTLEPLRVNITVVSIPNGADVFIDGKKAGKAPVTFTHDVDSQPPQLRLQKRGCEDYVTSVPFDPTKASQDVKLTLKCR